MSVKMTLTEAEYFVGDIKPDLIVTQKHFLERFLSVPKDIAFLILDEKVFSSEELID
jgi:hypothetical protein